MFSRYLPALKFMNTTIPHFGGDCSKPPLVQEDPCLNPSSATDGVTRACLSTSLKKMFSI